MKVSELQKALEVFAKYAPDVRVEAGEQEFQLHVFADAGQTDQAKALAGMVQYDLDRLDRLRWRPATKAEERPGNHGAFTHWVANT